MLYYNKLFYKECQEIQNKELHNILQNTVYNIPGYFYIIPSSSSGKYHPADELSDGGLLLHTLKTVKVAEVLAPMYSLTDYELELCKVALLLHDSCKSGKVTNCGHTEFLHPIFAAELVVESNPKNKTAKKVAKLIKTHMGIWTTSKYSKYKLQKPKTKLQKFVHLCDYVASRKDFQVKI